MKTICMTIFIAIALCAPLSAKIKPIRYFQADDRYLYRIKLLDLVLRKTVDSHGAYKLIPFPSKVTQKRGISLLKNGAVEVAFLPTSREREELLLPVKEPILRGILGYRVFLIHKSRSPAFAGVNTLEELTPGFQAGFGSQWADMEILKANNIRVTGVAVYQSLFKMLENNRFDYFPRGINEAWNEIGKMGSLYPGLTVEENLAFYYPYPVYFFVNKTNIKLAGRIRQGLTIALEDGSFKTLFLEYHKALIDHAKLDSRKIFFLKNPTLPPGTPEPDTSWWFSK